ncbi:hypothetical protein [Desulfovibrio oxyclinae]|uniref:hypothetical protein n=1 Tax=Desulfovibrio oxyclinae TaxID=63560 RepID=UPI0012E99D3D|nr:hypothetical protein [Desulfovibrio oxyclinae]
MSDCSSVEVDKFMLEIRRDSVPKGSPAHVDEWCNSEMHIPMEACIPTWNDKNNATDFVAEKLGNDLSEPSLVAVTEALHSEVLLGTPRDAACGAGCHYCCHIIVHASIPETIKVACGVDRSIFNRVHDQLDALSRDEWISYKNHWVENQIPCPFLLDGNCSVYECRPSVCRGQYSLNANECIDAYHSCDPESSVTNFFNHKRVSAIPRDALVDGCAAVGLHSYLVIMPLAVRILLKEKDAVPRWLAGEDVFREACAH